MALGESKQHGANVVIVKELASEDAVFGDRLVIHEVVKDSVAGHVRTPMP